jgi:hypothetical protein
MKRILNFTTLALAAFILLGTVSAMAVDRPFALNGKGASTFITDGAGNPIGANVNTSGTATHLGLWTSTGIVNFSPDPDNPGRTLSSGTGTFIAANGDKLTFAFTGVLEPSPGGETATDQGVFHFTGGTGRFADASGSVDALVVINVLTGAFEITMLGNIDY